MAKVNYLKRSPLFKNFTDKEIAVLAALMDERFYNINSFIFEEKSPVAALYFVKRGRIKLSKKLPGVENHPLVVLNPGQIFGEFSILHAIPKTYEAKALENVELLVLTKEKFDFLSEKAPSVALKLLKMIVVNMLMRWERISNSYLNDVIIFLFTRDAGG